MICVAGSGDEAWWIGEEEGERREARNERRDDLTLT